MKSTPLETVQQPILKNSASSSQSRPDTARKWIIKNMAPIIFFSAFFLTILMGNLLFATDFGREQLSIIPHYAKIYDFPTAFTPLYWILLFLPFFLAPPIIVLIQRYLELPIHRLCAKVPELRPLDYSIFTGTALCHVGYSLWQAHAFSLYGTGVDPVSSVEIRFQILSGLRFWTMAVLMSILPYLSVYALIRCIRQSNPFWITATILVVSIVSIYMILLNMKWPFLVFAAALILTIFAHSKTYPYIKVSIGTVALFAIYLIISTHVFRLADPVQPTLKADVETLATPEPTAPKQEVAAAQTPAGSYSEAKITPSANDASHSDTNATVASETPTVSAKIAAFTPHLPAKHSTQLLAEAIDLPKTALRRAPEILFSGLTRMAILYPFYYQIFTEEGNVCGGIVEQARRGPDCRPSTLVYTRVFGLDGFEGRGTAPTTVHISGYALGGWPIAMLAMVCASIILGLITCLPTNSSAMIGALGIMGAIGGYHFSQISGEGPLFYDHGLVWTLIPMAIYIAWRKLFTRPEV